MERVIPCLTYALVIAAVQEKSINKRHTKGKDPKKLDFTPDLGW